MTTLPDTYRAPSREGRITFSGLVRTEFISFFSLRSTYMALILGGGLTVLVSLAIGFLWISSADHPGTYAEATKSSLFIVQIVAVALGASSYAREHATGALRTLFAAAPHRVGILTAKAVVLGLSAFALTVLLLLLALVSTAAFYATQGVPDAVDGDVIVPLVAGGALQVALTSVFALGVAAMLRSEAWTITAMLVFLFVIPSLVALIPSEAGQAVYDILFMPASTGLLTPLNELDASFARDAIASVAWPAAAFTVGAVTLVRRDA